MSTIERDKDFNLEIPITHKGEEISTLTLKRPSMKALARFDNHKGGTLDGMLQLASDCAAKPKEMLEELDPIDFKPMADWLGETMGKFTQK